MRHTILLALMLAALSGHAQDTATKTSLWDRLRAPKVITEDKKLRFDSTINKVSYSEIVQAPGNSKESLIKKAKKWVTTRNSSANPYTVSYESEQEGSLIAKGSFTVPKGRKKYPVVFTVKVSTKTGKCKYEFTDFIVQYRTEAGSSGAGYGYWSKASYHAAETLEYTLETFYPERLYSKKPGIKYYEEFDSEAFALINKEMQSLTASLKQFLSSSESDW